MPITRHDVSVFVHELAIDAIHRDFGASRSILEAVDPYVRRARSEAPKATGRGAASIHAEAVLDRRQLSAHISWTRERFYMKYVHDGTQYMGARPFMIRALRGL